VSVRYEIYIDSLLLLNIGMNLYLLELTNCILHHTVRWKRVLFGAVCGGISSVIPFILPGKVGVLMGIGFLLDIVCMSFITFRVINIGVYLKILEVLSLLTIVFGTLLQYTIWRLPERIQMTPLVLLLVGGLFFIGIRRGVCRRNQSGQCKVILKNGKFRMRIDALVDTGNSLIEPISGEPVAVLDRGVFENLFLGVKPAGFRVIPYRSIDQQAGILPGYLIPEMIVEWKGFCKEYHNIYVGVREQDAWTDEAYKMIINPKMLKERKIG